ncbi:acVLRF1 family peptidyl-tRNA hydrolase [Nocardioides panaciterrulae]|uniref:Actinobacteria/chloroflexi VLRF1 release factor domain-containing protein n=1 Tax=Nocardioides panaciterrulae TaxID=661492 RepID=A0A7Y9E6H0_9ACTN|nr:hypothetical protein [Nocardioides panaciterrulae]
MPTVLVPASRLERWVRNFDGRHGTTALAVDGGALTGAAADGSTFVAHLPLAGRYAGLPDVAGFAAAAGELPTDWGVLLVRKGGFAVARMAGERVAGSKVGQRHVQGRTKAGGQSQQRFARRRDNQARQAYEAAADHAARLLGDLRGPLVAGGDRGAVHEVLDDPRLARLRPVEPWLPVPDPRRAVLDEAIGHAVALRVDVTNADAGGDEASDRA